MRVDDPVMMTPMERYSEFWGACGPCGLLGRGGDGKKRRSVTGADFIAAPDREIGYAGQRVGRFGSGFPGVTTDLSRTPVPPTGLLIACMLLCGISPCTLISCRGIAVRSLKLCRILADIISTFVLMAQYSR